MVSSPPRPGYRTQWSRSTRRPSSPPASLDGVPGGSSPSLADPAAPDPEAEMVSHERSRLLAAALAGLDTAGARDRPPALRPRRHCCADFRGRAAARFVGRANPGARAARPLRPAKAPSSRPAFPADPRARLAQAALGVVCRATITDDGLAHHATGDAAVDRRADWPSVGTDVRALAAERHVRRVHDRALLWPQRRALLLLARFPISLWAGLAKNRLSLTCRSCGQPSSAAVAKGVVGPAATGPALRSCPPRTAGNA